MMKGQFKRRNE